MSSAHKSNGMIFYTCNNANSDLSSSPSQINWLGAASRRALARPLMRLHAPFTRSLLNQHLEGKEGLQGLHLGCGSGEDSFLIASVLDAQSSLKAIDGDPVLIQQARQAMENTGIKALRFEEACLERWSQTNDEDFDFIYARCWRAAFPNLQQLLEGMFGQLRGNGLLLLELMSFSGYNVFPYNHACARATELIGQVEEAQAGTVDQWLIKLEKIGFTQIDFEASSPGFIDTLPKHIISLMFEAFGLQILDQTEASSAELNALLLELKAYEQQQDILISRPSVHQILARK